MGAESPFVDLRRLADWFVTSPTRPSLHVERIVARLGATAVPLLGRELTGADPRRRDAARAALVRLAESDGRARVIAELRAITDGPADDAGKVSALGLLAELGERGIARFADPSAIQRSSALALAAHLDTACDVAAAAGLMVEKLADDDLVKLLAVMADAAPAAAHRIAAELCTRLDVALELRERIAEVALLHAAPDEPGARKPTRPTHVKLLVDGARTVIVAIRKVTGEKRWRRWAVLIDERVIESPATAGRAVPPKAVRSTIESTATTGRAAPPKAVRSTIESPATAGRAAPPKAVRSVIGDCLHEESNDELDAGALVHELVADGYRVVPAELDDVRARIAAAARATAEELPAAYYIGRDLLDLGDVHLSQSRVHPTSATIGRAVELIADGDVPRARLLLARCDGESADVAAATAACLLAQSRPADAVPHLQHACALEPAWPLHHWNLAAAHHAIGDAAACHQALRRFVSTSASPTGLVGDPDQPTRVAQACRLMAELERTARLAGKRLRKR